MRGKRLTKQAAALAIAVATLAGCSSSGGTTQGATGALPGGNPPAHTSPSPSPFPSPTGPPVRGGLDHIEYKAQIVSVGTSAALPNVAAPAGKTALLIRLRITSDPEGRTIKAPLAMAWTISNLGCQHACWGVDGESHFVTEADARAGHTGDAVSGGYGTLNAGTAYYTYLWKFVPENADLHDSQLCASALDTPQTCAPSARSRRWPPRM